MTLASKVAPPTVLHGYFAAPGARDRAIRGSGASPLAFRRVDGYFRPHEK
ncbi:hypothetical protein [Palleronia abyssalis]|nr:hypothetical protein [Palleronia abyssalis]